VRSADGTRPGRRQQPSLRPELLGLVVGAGSELLARDPGREAEVVLDPRAGAGLASGRGRFQRKHVEPFRGPVNGGRQPRRPRPHDEEVADPGVVDRVVEAETIGDLPIGRVAQHNLAAADEDGHVLGGDVEAI
jgi:hypothetical protein